MLVRCGVIFPPEPFFLSLSLSLCECLFGVPVNVAQDPPNVLLQSRPSKSVTPPLGSSFLPPRKIDSRTGMRTPPPPLDKPFPKTLPHHLFANPPSVSRAPPLPPSEEEFRPSLGLAGLAASAWFDLSTWSFFRDIDLARCPLLPSEQTFFPKCKA